MRKVAIIGAGMTAFGEHWEQGFRDLVVEAGLKAIVDAGISGDRIDAGYVGTMASGPPDRPGAHRRPDRRLHGAEPDSGDAGRRRLRFREPGPAAGLHGCRQRHPRHRRRGRRGEDDRPGRNTVSDILGGAGDQEWELFLGATFPAIYALMAQQAHARVRHHRRDDGLGRGEEP